MNNHHFLLISLPAQGHINPTLQLAKNLARAGASVTFTTTISGLRQLKNLSCFDGLTYASISDGYDSDNSITKTPGYLANLKLVGSQNLTNLLHKLSADDHRPVNFLVYTILLPWVAEVARDMPLPSAFLAIQSANSFSIYYRFFNIHDGIYSTNKDIDPSMSLELPGMPLLTYN